MDQYPTAASLSYPDAPLRQQVLHVLAQHPTGFTPLSMGGFGTWAFALAYPDRCAAIAPICGGGDPARVGAIRHLPVWAFHGAKDTIVPLRRSAEMVTALRQCGGNVRFTVYPDAVHDAWTETYTNPELYAWFLAHTRAH